MASRRDLSARITALLDARRARGRAGKAAVTLTCAIAALVVTILAPLTVGASPQDAPKPRFQVSSNFVAVTVTVTDESGRSVLNLHPADFALTEDGRRQNLSSFEEQRPGVYLLGYYTPGQSADNQFHKIAVTMPGFSNLKLDFREGFYTNRPAPQSPPAPGPALAPPPGTRPPVLVVKVEPEYSEEARKAKYQGEVRLSVVVDTAGQPSNIRVLHAIGLGLDEKAKEAVAKWRFRPATNNGKPVEMETEVTVTFRLL
jgi:TonB family protein